MFFLTLTSCQKNYIEIEKTNKTIIKDEIEHFTFDISTNIEEITLVKVENNDSFEYTLTNTNNGKTLDLVLYKPNSFTTLTFMSNNQEYICNIGNITLIETNYETNNVINILVDDDGTTYIYNKLPSAIIIRDLRVYGGDFIYDANYNDLIQPKRLNSIGHIFDKEESIVIYIKYQYQTIDYEELFEMKKSKE